MVVFGACYLQEAGIKGHMKGINVQQVPMNIYYSFHKELSLQVVERKFKQLFCK